MCLRRRYLYLPTHDMQALDIFAQFFVSPLMKADSSDRELQSIESEFCLSKNSDSCRLQELWCHTCKRGENTQRRVQTVHADPLVCSACFRTRLLRLLFSFSLFSPLF